MELQQLTTFVKVSELLSFSKTAEALGYSQAAVTIQIKQLETELGVQLFDRIGKKIALTSEGVTLQQYAVNILLTTKEAQAALASQSAQGPLRIGASESLCTYILPAILADFHQQYPDVTLSLKTGNVTQLTTMLQQNEVDLICLFEKENALSDHRLLFSQQESFVFIASPTHPLSKKKQLTLTELSKASFLLTEPGCSYRLQLEQLFTQQHLPLHICLEIGSPEAIKRFCTEGLGIALLPYFTVAKECATKELLCLSVTPMPLSLSHQLICHKHKYLSATIKAFIALYTARLKQNKL